MRNLALSAVVASALVLGCAGPAATPSATVAPLTVVATTTVFADLVKQVGGDHVQVHSLVPKGGEVHTFDPAPSDAARVAGAQLMVLNGLGLDDWLLPFAQEVGAADIPLLEMGEDIPDVQYIEGGEEHQEPEPSGHAGEEHLFNPHLWMNPAYAKIYVDRIRAKLNQIDPAGQSAYDANAAAFVTRLDALDTYARDQLGSIPAESRRVVSFHDAFPYFAQAYRLEIVGVVVQAPGQDPSAGEVAALIDAIRATGVKAILSESQFPHDLVDTIANETGAKVVSDLYTDTLGEAPIDSYEAAMRFDVDQITAALR